MKVRRLDPNLTPEQCLREFRHFDRVEQRSHPRLRLRGVFKFRTWEEHEKRRQANRQLR